MTYFILGMFIGTSVCFVAAALFAAIPANETGE